MMLEFGKNYSVAPLIHEERARAALHVYAVARAAAIRIEGGSLRCETRTLS